MHGRRPVPRKPVLPSIKGLAKHMEAARPHRRRSAREGGQPRQTSGEGGGAPTEEEEAQASERWHRAVALLQAPRARAAAAREARPGDAEGAAGSNAYPVHQEVRAGYGTHGHVALHNAGRGHQADQRLVYINTSHALGARSHDLPGGVGVHGLLKLARLPRERGC